MRHSTSPRPRTAGYGCWIAAPLRGVFTTSGSGGLEAAVGTTLSPGDRVLGVSAGALGNRFRSIAEAYGAVGLRAEKPSEVVPVLKEALKIKRPVFMDFVVDWREKVYPMVPAGASIDQMLFHEPEEKPRKKKLRAVK